jgi:DNA polymerase I-like protein with 3'-5' exonuclease and polymerase domains
MYDFRVAVAAIKGKMKNLAPPVDEFEGQEEYYDVTGLQTVHVLREARKSGLTVISLDTEGIPGEEWSIQFSLVPGTGYVLRCQHVDFVAGINAIVQFCHYPEVVVVMQNSMYDLEMCRGMGADLFDVRLYDTRYSAYAMRLEPQALKPLLYRWCGMRQASYEDTVGPAGLAKQLDYLDRVAMMEWPVPEMRIEYKNDGTFHPYTPQPVTKRALAILNDYYSGKLDKDGDRTDPLARWKKVDTIQRRMVEAMIGRMPIGTLADIPLKEAIHYAARDADGTLRLYYRQLGANKAQGLVSLVQDGNGVLPVFEEMQSTGMRPKRDYCVAKQEEMTVYMNKVGARISVKYYGGQPFNPNSPDKVAALMRRRGLVGEKRSKITRKMSTGKKSIEHLRYSDDAMKDVIDWREHQKMRDSFYGPIVERIDDAVAAGANPATFRIRTKINPYKVVSRRISSSDPNLTAIPVRNELGTEVRDGFEAEEGCELGSWDLSQIEMRYMAHVSRDPLLVKFFGDPKLDVHCETAARIFGLKINDKADNKAERYANIDEMEHRYPSKRAGFGIITNIQGMGLLDQLRMFGCKGWTEDRCDELIDNWLGVYKGVKVFMDESKREAQQFGVIRDAWGMPRYLPGVWSPDAKVRAEAERAASSMRIQGGAQGMIQKSMIWLKPYVRAMQQAGLRVRWVLQIHDEIIMEFQEDLWDTINPLIIEGLTEHSLKLIVPVKASGSHAKTWGKLKG